MSEALVYLREVAPPDVRAAVAWLLTQGFRTSRDWGGRHESFGNVLVEFTGPEAVVTVTRDRSQWQLDLRPRGWTLRVDLELVLDAIANRQSWPPASSSEPLSDQLPPGVQWVDELPRALNWLAVNPGAEDDLAALRDQRSRQLLPGLYRSRD